MANVQRIDISSSTIFRTILILLAFWFLYVVSDVVVILVAAIVVAAAIEPLANRLQRYRIPRALSVVLIYALGFGALAAVVTLIFPILAEQTLQLGQSIPHIVDVLQGWLGHTFFISSEAVSQQLQTGLTQFGNELGNVGLNVVQQTSSVFSSIASVFFVFAIALYLVIEKNALAKFFHIVIPAEHHTYVDLVVQRAQYKIGRWALGQLALGAVIGVIVTVGLWFMGIPYALALGLLAGVFEIVPVIGPILAAIPGVIVGFTQSWIFGIAVLVFYILVQQVENHVLIPNVMRKVTGLNPLVTLLAVLLGARLFGLAGVILAVPVATVFDVVLSDLFGKKEVEPSV